MSNYSGYIWTFPFFRLDHANEAFWVNLLIRIDLPLDYKGWFVDIT